MAGDRSSGMREGAFAQTVRIDGLGGVIAEDDQSRSCWLRFTLMVNTLSQPTEQEYKRLREEGAAGVLTGLACDLLQTMGISSMSGIGSNRVVVIVPPGADLETNGIVGIYQCKNSEHVELLTFSNLTGGLETCHVPFSYGAMQTVWDLRGLDGLVRALYKLNLKLQPEWLFHASTETLELITKPGIFRYQFYALQRLGRYVELAGEIINIARDGIAECRDEDMRIVAKYADKALWQALKERHDNVYRSIFVLRPDDADDLVLDGC